MICKIVGALVLMYATRKNQDFSITYRTVATALFPFLLNAIVPDASCNHHAMLPSTLWMTVMWMFDTYTLKSETPSVTTGSRGVRFDTHSVTALSFGLCGLVGARADTRYVHLIVYAILGCVMLVLPTHTLSASDPLFPFVEETQRMALVYCIALLIAGVTLTRCTSSPSSS